MKEKITATFFRERKLTSCLLQLIQPVLCYCQLTHFVLYYWLWNLMQSFQLVKGVSNLQIILFANVPKNISLQKLQSSLNVLLS